MSSIEKSFNYCESLAKNHYENFPVGSFLIPKEKRKYVWAIYAFARTADDFSDEGRHPQESPSDCSKRLEQLDDWEEKLIKCGDGEATHPIFIALSETLKEFEIPIQTLKDLLTAYRMDVQKNRYQSFDELLYYCQHSANPIGRLVLYTFRHKEESLHQLSDKICTALQLTNFWQDISIDLAKDRIYLPQDKMNEFGVTEKDLHEKNCHNHFKTLLKFCTDKTAALFNEGLPLYLQVRKDLKYEMKLTWLGGTTILKKIVQSDYDVFHHRPMINHFDKATLLIRSFLPLDLQPIDASL